jgi:nucleotide-binding universal stress UspA family protein
MRLLVITTEPISADQLRDALHWAADLARVEVMLVAPALHDSPLTFWLSDADDAIARADRVRRDSLARLEAEGIAAHGDTGEGDPLDAIEDALRTFNADHIVLFTHPPGKQRYREDIDPHEVEQRFGLPVDRALVAA